MGVVEHLHRNILNLQLLLLMFPSLRKAKRDTIYKSPDIKQNFSDQDKVMETTGLNFLVCNSILACWGQAVLPYLVCILMMKRVWYGKAVRNNKIKRKPPRLSILTSEQRSNCLYVEKCFLSTGKCGIYE